MRLNHLIALVIGCNARKLTCWTVWKCFSKVSILQCAQVLCISWLFIAFQEDSLIAVSINSCLVTKKLMYFVDTFNYLICSELTTVDSFFFSTISFVKTLLWGWWYMSWWVEVMLPNASRDEVDRSPCGWILVQAY